eukprot:CAMPEP_0172894342 /NCGR_PEP_ID=MMETSP1075-20121228/150717_1 /TAXON_ID=2916 /ORGANISM="Ceratium fusus, Strain PA161109" /LENGTH=192 /DNA_ID=CAMNT_0013749353 /DNA_START=179 /DNA_END=753 /DNA_ORIENTATION=+
MAMSCSGSTSSSESSPEASPESASDNEHEQPRHGQEEKLEDVEPCNESIGLDMLLAHEIASFMAMPIDLDRMTLGQFCRELECRLGFQSGSLAEHKDMIGLLVQAELLGSCEDETSNDLAPNRQTSAKCRVSRSRSPAEMMTRQQFRRMARPVFVQLPDRELELPVVETPGGICGYSRTAEVPVSIGGEQFG